MRRKLYDSKCLELAEHFFAKTPREFKERIASEIQDLIESYPACSCNAENEPHSKTHAAYCELSSL